MTTWFVAKRFTSALAVVFVVATLAFFLMNAVGDPATVQLGPQASAEQRAAYRRSRGLDRPLIERYAAFLRQTATGDLGVSYRVEAPRVVDVIAPRIPRTALLGGLALCFEIILGLTVGVVAASRRKSWVDHTLMGGAFLGVSAPTFITGIVFLNVLAFSLGWFPVGGYGVTAFDHVKHAVLPAFTLAIAGAASLARLVRSDMVETIALDHVRTARAKGLPWRTVLVRHVLRNALVSVATVVGMSIPMLVSGAIITEQIYGWPGVGRLAVESISAGDTPVVLALVLLSSVAVQVGSFLADVTIAALDPRVRR